MTLENEARRLHAGATQSPVAAYEAIMALVRLAHSGAMFPEWFTAPAHVEKQLRAAYRKWGRYA